MDTQWRHYLRELLTGLRSTDYIMPYDIPNIDLYMDQVTTFMDEHLETTKRYEDDKLLTKTMINNYTKNDLLPSPIKKKYSKDHMYLLVFIYYLKSFLSIRDVQHIVGPMAEMFYGENKKYSLEEIYKQIFHIEEEVSQDLGRDVMNKFMRSKHTFEEVEDEEAREFLNIFSFISMLSFDVYLKKQMIEKIIDDLLKPSSSEEEKKPKKATGKEQE